MMKGGIDADCSRQPFRFFFVYMYIGLTRGRIVYIFLIYIQGRMILLSTWLYNLFSSGQVILIVRIYKKSKIYMLSLQEKEYLYELNRNSVRDMNLHG